MSRRQRRKLRNSGRRRSGTNHQMVPAPPPLVSCVAEEAGEGIQPIHPWVPPPSTLYGVNRVSNTPHIIGQEADAVPHSVTAPTVASVLTRIKAITEGENVSDAEAAEVLFPMAITLRYPGTCRVCGTELGIGQQARWYGGGSIDGVSCHEDSETGQPKRAKRAKRAFGTIFPAPLTRGSEPLREGELLYRVRYTTPWGTRLTESVKGSWGDAEELLRLMDNRQSG